jgi:hypothetical protein
VYCLFLDNLFININVYKALLTLNIVTMGTVEQRQTGRVHSG